MGDVLKALNAAIKAATHLDAKVDGPTIQAARALALKIDVQDEYFEKLAAWADEVDGRPPSQDNVSIPTFLKYMDALGLTPVARSRLDVAVATVASKKAPAAAQAQAGKFRGLSAVPRPS